MGHNLGMSHDFDKKHGGDNGRCNNKGIMSYGRGIPTTWSDCSISDFSGAWQTNNWASTCFGR